MATPWASSSSTASTTSRTDRSWPRCTTSAPCDCRIRRMMLIAASCPANSAAAVTKRTGRSGRCSGLASAAAMRTPRSLDGQYLDVKVTLPGESGTREVPGPRNVTGTITVQYGEHVPDSPFDPIAEAHRQWSARWPGQADHMAAVTSVMRVQQLLLSGIENTLKPYGLPFAAYEALRLLAFSRRGSLPMGKMGERLMVHPASVTNAISRLEQRGLVGRLLSPDDRRVVLATITGAGKSLVGEATMALNQASFGLPGISPEDAAAINAVLRGIRAAANDLPAEPAPASPEAAPETPGAP